MLFQMKVQPVDIDTHEMSDVPSRAAESSKPVLRWRLRRLFDRQFTSVLKSNNSSSTSTTEKASKGFGRSEEGRVEPSSVVLAKMVQNFIEEGNDKPNQNKYGKTRCNCFNGNVYDSSDDEFDVFSSVFSDSLSYINNNNNKNNGSSSDVSDILKSLVACVSTVERRVLAETTKIIEKNNKTVKRKVELRKLVADDLVSLGYNASICKSKWEKTPYYPAGVYEYIDVIVEEEGEEDGERLLIDIEFRSEFEIATPTFTYESIIQSLPCVFVGKSDRIAQIVSIVSECAKMSLKKKGLYVPPWRKAEYMRAKWLCQTFTRASPSKNDKVVVEGEEEDGVVSKVLMWQLPEVKPKQRAAGKMVTGLASLLKDKT